MVSNPVGVGHWVLDPVRTSVRFSQKTMWGLVTVKGSFSAESGEGDVAADGSVTGSLVIDPASVDTKNKKRDIHLRSADFFDVETKGSITFAVHGVEGSGSEADVATITGELTVTGVTKPLAVSATVVPASADAVTVTTDLVIDRTDFGMTWNKVGVMKGATTLSISAAFTRQAG
jgi:polyisoprenoid-binding protein YceI